MKIVHHLAEMPLAKLLAECSGTVSSQHFIGRPARDYLTLRSRILGICEVNPVSSCVTIVQPVPLLRWTVNLVGSCISENLRSRYRLPAPPKTTLGHNSIPELKKETSFWFRHWYSLSCTVFLHSAHQHMACCIWDPHFTLMASDRTPQSHSTIALASPHRATRSCASNTSIY